MNWILQNIALLSLVISLINIAITLYNWYLRHPRLVFYEAGNENYFYRSGENERSYINSKCVAFFYLKIANLSDLPCTISEISLKVDGYPVTYYRSNTQLLDKYILSRSEDRPGIKEIFITRELIIKLPCTIPPLGYFEGNVVFPYAPEYNNKQLYAKLTVRTARKNFKTCGFIAPYVDKPDAAPQSPSFYISDHIK